MHKIYGMFGMFLIVGALAGLDVYVLTRAQSLSMLAEGDKPAGTMEVAVAIGTEPVDPRNSIFRKGKSLPFHEVLLPVDERRNDRRYSENDQ